MKRLLLAAVAALGFAGMASVAHADTVILPGGTVIQAPHTIQVHLAPTGRLYVGQQIGAHELGYLGQVYTEVGVHVVGGLDPLLTLQHLRPANVKTPNDCVPRGVLLYCKGMYNW